MTDQESKARDEHLLRKLKYAVHELPAGVLYDANSANAKQCQEWITDLNEFKSLCRDLGREHTAFVEDCRWHFVHYAHYLGRRRHFVNYRTYIEDRNGPLRVRGS